MLPTHARLSQGADFPPQAPAAASQSLRSSAALSTKPSSMQAAPLPSTPQPCTVTAHQQRLVPTVLVAAR